MSSFRVARDRVSVISDSIRVGGEQKKPETKKPLQASESPAEAAPEEQKISEVREERANAAELQALQEKQERLEEAMRLVNGLHEAAQSAKADAEKRAREIIAEAEARAQQMMVDAEAAIEQEMEAGRQRGYADGTAKAEEEALARKNFEADQLRQMIGDVRAEREKMIDGLEGEIIETVIAIAKKTIHSQIRDNEVFLGIVRSEMAELKNTDSITVSVAVQDFVRLFGSNEGVSEQFPDGNVKVVADKELTEGDCVIETEAEVVDCGINGQLEKVEELLRAEIEEE